jgi:threonine/homoserine/homoserine lactone efflux protein
VLFNAIKLVGAAYLIWIGIKALRSKKTKTTTQKKAPRSEISSIEAVKQGFLTNVLNPKATLFFLSLFAQVISTETSSILKLVYGLEMTVATFLWFTLVALFMTRKPIQLGYAKVKHHIDRLFGAALIALGLKVGLG